MGSSVFHGGFSTFLALSVLAPSKTYIFVVFYKMWCGIIIFGMANGFLLLPVILSYVGTTETVVDHSTLEHGQETEDNEDKTPKPDVPANYEKVSALSHQKSGEFVDTPKKVNKERASSISSLVGNIRDSIRDRASSRGSLR